MSETAEALARLGESVELTIVAWTEDFVKADGLKDFCLAVAPEVLWVTGQNYNQGRGRCTEQLWRCRPGKRLCQTVWQHDQSLFIQKRPDVGV